MKKIDPSSKPAQPSLYRFYLESLLILCSVFTLTVHASDHRPLGTTKLEVQQAVENEAIAAMATRIDQIMVEAGDNLGGVFAK